MRALNLVRKMKKVRKLINLGITKEEAFKIATEEEGLDPKKVGRYLVSFADSFELEKHKTLHKVLILLISVTTFIKLVGLVPMFIQETLAFQALILGVLAFNLWIIISTYIGQAIGFYAYAFFSAREVMNAFKVFDINDEFILLSIGLHVPVIILSIYVKNKLFPHQGYLNRERDYRGIPIFSGSSLAERKANIRDKVRIEPKI